MIAEQLFLEQTLTEAIESVAQNNQIQSVLSDSTTKHLDEILFRAESAKGVLTVVITSAAYKHFHPTQDIRNHQSSIPNGYSGRTFDGAYITPFLKKHRFPAMAESGWLTRSLEQKQPYDEKYPGAITPNSLKIAFISTLQQIQEGVSPSEILSYLFQGLVIQRNQQMVDLAKPTNLPIKVIIKLLEMHFASKYASEGAARLPVLALYAVYQCLIGEVKRFENKKLAPIESHTSADTRSGRIGDLEVWLENKTPFEALEVKHGVGLTAQLVRDSFEKFSKTQVDRYYLLSTKEEIDTKEKVAIEAEIERIKNIHGCQVIVNGVVKTLLYYLRLLNNPAAFIARYVDLVEEDKALKFEHKQRWNEIISNL
jgi:DNA (cytosine-5)-methyltransferase 1